MGHDLKYGTVTTEHGDIPGDEPVIVFRARDALACSLISAYYNLCSAQSSPPAHLLLVEKNYKAFADWQEAHPDMIRIPDSAAHRERLEAGNREP